MFRSIQIEKRHTCYVVKGLDFNDSLGDGIGLTEELAIGNFIINQSPKFAVENNDPEDTISRWTRPVCVWSAHDGFTNELTWIVALWVNNNQGVRESLLHAISHCPSWAPEDLKEWFKSRLPDCVSELRFVCRASSQRSWTFDPGIFKLMHDLIRCAADLVDWDELSVHFLGQVKEAQDHGETFGPPDQGGPLRGGPDAATEGQSSATPDRPGETPGQDVPRQQA